MFRVFWGKLVHTLNPQKRQHRCHQAQKISKFVPPDNPKKQPLAVSSYISLCNISNYLNFHYKKPFSWIIFGLKQFWNNWMNCEIIDCHFDVFFVEIKLKKVNFKKVCGHPNQYTGFRNNLDTSLIKVFFFTSTKILDKFELKYLLYNWFLQRKQTLRFAWALKKFQGYWFG